MGTTRPPCGWKCFRTSATSPSGGVETRERGWVSLEDLKASKSVTLPRDVQHMALKPSRDGGALRAVGVGDRGGGLVYSAGRLRNSPREPGEQSTSSSGKDTEVFIVKVQAPLDNSDDARGGIGRMVPQTLLIHDETAQFVRFVEEREYGHTALLRAVLSERLQIAYIFALFDRSVDIEAEENMVNFFTELTPMQEHW